MVQSQFSLLWDSHKTNLCSGFASLQQNGELVDMTLAADGHFVKVHQALLALASPYLKQLILSVPSRHPVIILNNMSHETLTQILEYIYTGQALVPSENLSTFIEAAKSLHIKGLENVIENKDSKFHVNVSNSGSTPSSKRESNVSQKILLPAAARKCIMKTESNLDRSPVISDTWTESHDTSAVHSYSMDTDDHDNDSEDNINSSNMELSTGIKHETPKASSNVQFTVSIRGSLQIILNRYIYNAHSTKSTGIRRWRCIDYRNKKCLAFVVTNGNIVLNRANPHNHSFHDKKILDKIEKNAVYSALDEVQDYIGREKAREENEQAESEFVALEISAGLNNYAEECKLVQSLNKNS